MITPMRNLQMRPHQREAKAAVLASTQDRQLVCLPTGTGKTVLARPHALKPLIVQMVCKNHTNYRPYIFMDHDSDPRNIVGINQRILIDEVYDEISSR